MTVFGSMSKDLWISEVACTRTKQHALTMVAYLVAPYGSRQFREPYEIRRGHPLSPTLCVSQVSLKIPDRGDWPPVASETIGYE